MDNYQAVSLDNYNNMASSLNKLKALQYAPQLDIKDRASFSVAIKSKDPFSIRIVSNSPNNCIPWIQLYHSIRINNDFWFERLFFQWMLTIIPYYLFRSWKAMISLIIRSFNKQVKTKQIGRFDHWYKFEFNVL